jgi:7,8-dihydropterin-6-yl-methyl-4-(beta-D-ribofuranosyl)aminobenzene 5'-phosphate synthase
MSSSRFSGAFGDLQLIAAAQCTGWRALGQLAQRFGDRVVASPVGKRFVL